MLAIINLGGGEIILVLALVLILFTARNGKLAKLARGLLLGIDRARDAVDEASEEAGRSAGGIYGKPAAQALTPDNQVAELYDAYAFQREPEPKRRKTRRDVLFRWWRWIRGRVRKVG